MTRDGRPSNPVAPVTDAEACSATIAIGEVSSRAMRLLAVAALGGQLAAIADALFASEGQLVSAKEVELTLAQREAKITVEKKRGVLEAEGVERSLRAEQQLAENTAQIKIEEEKRKSELSKAQTEAEAIKIRADADAHAIRVRADADRSRIAAASQNLSPNYVRIQALQALSTAIGSGDNNVMVLPVGKDGLPAYFAPFLNPFSNFMGALPGAGGHGKSEGKL